MLRIIFFLLFLLSLLPFFLNFFTVSKENKSPVNANELYIPELSKLDNVKKLVSYVDSLYYNLYKPNFDTMEYVGFTTKVVKQRFYHGLAKYDISENWIAYLVGKTVWSHVSAVVEPNDILKHSEGLCSQQTIVFMEALKAKGINVRSVGLGYEQGPGHFLCEVMYGGTWHLHDVTLEPEWIKIVKHHLSLEYYLDHTDSLYIVYEKRLTKPHYSKLLEKVEYGKVNEFPASNMRIFHFFTRIATYLLPVFFLWLMINSLRKSSKF